MIVFKTIRWKNFLSTGNYFTEVLLDRSPTTLVVGENGAGKSTVLDAICFALFGKPFRKISKPQLINSINKGGAVVEVEFTIGRKEYLVRRGIKPGIFEIELGGMIIDQNANLRDQQDVLEKTILKLNYKSFTQVVILGSASFTPFMQLSASHRREVIENLLDIEIFSTMNSLLKTKMNQIKNDLQECTNQIDVTKEKLRLQHEYLTTIKNDNSERKKQAQDEIEKTRKEIDKHSEMIEELQTQIDDNTALISDLDKVTKSKEKMTEMKTKLTSTLKKHTSDITFYENNDNCPTCHQDIDETFKHTTLTNITQKRSEVEKAMTELGAMLDGTIARLNEIQTVQATINKLNTDIMVEANTVTGLQKYITKVQKDLTDLIEEEVQRGDSSKVSEYEESIRVLSKAKENLIEQQYIQSFAATLLKDTGIKTKIIRQYLPIMNKLVNKYLSAMEFFVQFELDENFNEKIKSRFRDEFSYDSFSEGEKMRIDLALLFTWRSIAKMKNSINTNLLILDEVFDSSLDGSGTDEFLKILGTLGIDTNIFVISHKGDQLFDKFHSVIRFEKVKNYSRIAK